MEEEVVCRLCGNKSFHFLQICIMKIRLGLHLGFWLFYLILTSYITADLGNSSYREYSWAYRLGIAMIEKIGIVAIQASVFYWLFYFCLPRLKKANFKMILQLILGVVVSILVYRLWIGVVLYPMIYEEEYQGNPFALSLMFFSFINIYSFVGIAGAIKLIRNREKQKIVEQQLIKEKLQSELHFLRAQINPHFFFNTLNNIYGLARRQSENTAEVVMRLSKLMRFILYECTSDKIPILQEIKVLEDYIELEKLRYNERLKVEFKKEVDDYDQEIAPLLLLPFVENSFKHGASEMRFETEINIELVLREKKLFFSVSNKKEVDLKKNEKGLGLQNVKRQLELLYPEKYELIVEDEEDTFKVQLKIDLI